MNSDETLESQFKTLQHVRYAYWRMSMWLAGYGTYNDIDRGVEKGKYKPGIFPHKQETPDPQSPIPDPLLGGPKQKR